MPLLTGQCLCGAISYEINGEIGPISHCHCMQCRRWHNAAFRTRTAVRKQDFTWMSGLDLLSRYQSSEHVTRTFCSQCGSNLITYHAKYQDIIGVPLAGINENPGKMPQYHIFVASKAPWDDICDDLPQYSGWPVKESNEQPAADDNSAE